MSSKPAAAAAASSAHKRKRADASGAAAATPAAASAASAAPAPDLAQWMRDVIAAPVAPEDRPDPAEERALPADAIVDDDSDSDDEAVAPAGSAALAALSAAAGAGSARPAGAYASSIPRAHFGSVRDLFTCLTSSKTDTVFSGLVRFHRQMKDETTFGSSFAAGAGASGSLLAQYWSLSPDAKELFTILDTLKSFEPSKKQNQICGKIFEVFARMILPSSAGFDYALANNLIRRVVRSKHFGSLARITKMQDQRLVHAGLNFILHTIMCCGSNVTHLAGVGSAAPKTAVVAVVEPTGPKAPSRGSNALLREFVMKFEWSAKWFLEIPTKPFAAAATAGATAAAGKKGEQKDSSDQHQTMLIQLAKSRLLYIHIVIELLSKRDLQITTYLLGIKGYLTSVLKNLKNDPTSAGHLDALLHGLVHHILYLPGLPAQAKFGFFNSYVLEHLMELFRPRTNLVLLHAPAVAGGGKKRGGSGLKAVSGKEALELIERTLREFVAYLSRHQVRASVAINLKQNRVALADSASQATSLKQHGPLLLRILHSLHANESACEQRLLLDILSSFPVGLLGEFLAHFSYTFDPRPSFRWVNHVALICKIWEMRWEAKLAALAGHGAAGTLAHAQAHAPAFLGGSSKAAQVEDEFVMLHPLQPLGAKSSSSSSSAAASSAANSAAAVPTLFAFLLPSTLSQRIILSQCIQHSSSLVKYTTLNMLRSLLLRFEQLTAEYERQWRRAQGLSSAAPRPALLQANLASCRAHLAKILPDVQVLFGLRTKLLPAQSLTIEEMQAELEGPEEADAPAGKKARVATDSKPSKNAEDSATSDQSVESTADLALKSRHVVYSRFLAVLASYARALPEALLEGRIDVFKLLPASLSGVSNTQPALSWWALNELMDVLAHASAWKHTRLFGLTQQTKSGANQPADPEAVALVPLSYFGQMLRLFHSLCDPASEASALLMVNGHESVLSTGGDRPSQASPARVTERVKEFLTAVLLHTGLFSSASASASGSAGAYNPSAAEEIHLWLSSLRTAADLRFFEHLVAHLVNTNSVAGAFGSGGKDDAASSKASAAAEVKISALLSTACSASFQAYFIAATPYAAVDQLSASLSALLARFIGRAVASPTMGGLIHAQITAALEARTPAAVVTAASSSAAPKKVGSNALFASLPSSLPALLKHVSKVVGASDSAAAGSLELFQSTLSALRAKPSSKSGAEQVVRLAAEHFAVPHRAESTKGVLLAYAREALLSLLGSGASAEAGALAVWKAIASVIRSAEFEAPIPEAAPLSAEHCECTPAVAAARLAVVLAPSVSGAAEAVLLRDHFNPSAEDAFTKQVAAFLLSLPLASEPALHQLAAPMLNAVVQACMELGKTAAPELEQLPFTLHLLQQSLPLLSREQLSSVSHALCDPSTAWVLRIASVPVSASFAAAKLGEQLLQHGGANSIQMLAGMLMASKAGGAAASEKKKSSKKAAASASASSSAASPLVLERLLLKLLSSSNEDASLWLSQLQPTFFAFCLESITTPAAAASSDSDAGSDLFAQLAALFLSSEVSSLYVALFVAHVAQSFGGESEEAAAQFDEAAQAELVQLLPMLVRAASSSHLALVGAQQASWFVSFVLRALSQALLPYFLDQHSAASKASAAPAAVARLESITELVRVVAVSSSFAAQFSVQKRQQLLQFVLTGSKPELIGSASAAAASAAAMKKAPAKKQSSKKKKKQSSKMTDSDSSSSSSDSDSDNEDGDVAMSSAVAAADSKYEVFDALRFALAHTLLTAVAPSAPSELAMATAEGVGAAPESAAVRASLAQSYCHLLSQGFSTLAKGLKAAAKAKEAHTALVAAASAAMLGGDYDMAGASSGAGSKAVKGLLSPEFERRLLAALNELLSTGMDSTFLAHSATPAAKAAKWVAMLPLSSLLRESPNAGLSAQLLGSYSKLFPSLLRYAYTSLAHTTLLRNCLLLQLSGSFSRGVFLTRIVGLRSNMHFSTVIEGGEEEEGEAQEEPEVPSLLSICALASSPEAENFQPLSAVVGAGGKDQQAALREAASQVPTAQAIFELMVSHSKFVSVIAPGAVAVDEAAEDEDEEEARAGAAHALQLEFLRILLLLFSFPDSSPPADFSLQSNLWLLLLSQFHASISASDSYIKLLLDLFEEIALGAQARKRHKKMEFELIVSQRKWGDAGLAALTSRMSDGDGSAAEALTLTNQDPALWLYTNFNAAMLYKGPIVSRIPASRIQSHVAAASAGVAEQAIIQEQASTTAGDDAAAAAGAAASGMVDDTSSSSDLRYDPSFVLPFLHHFLVHHSADLRKLIELNALGFVIQCMSHQSLAIRKMAYATMGKFQSALESANEKLNAEKAAEKKAAEEAAVAATKMKDEDASDSDDEIGGSRSKRGLPPLPSSAPPAAAAKADKLDKNAKGSKTWEAKKALYHDAHRTRSTLQALGPDGQPLLYSFKEYPQIALLLSSLKNGITQKFQSVPHIVSTFLARILPILLRPDHALYKIVNRFLLARPLLDLSDIPLFYNLFQSAAPGDAFRFQRNFMLKVLRDGFSAPQDYPLVHRRHVATILMSYVSNRALSDKYTRGHSLQMMEGGLSASPHFLAEVLRVHALFPWVHAQLLATTQANQWAPGIVPILRVLDRACMELRAKIPAQAEEDVAVEVEGEAELVEEEDAVARATGKEAEDEDDSSSSSSEDEEEEEEDKKKKSKSKKAADDDSDMKDAAAASAAPATKVSKRAAPKSRAAKAPLSPAAEALKALRKRQRQRAQVSREINLLLEALASKFHEFAWSEKIVSVVAPSAAVAGAHAPLSGGASATPALQPLSTQLSVVEFVLSLLVSMLQTSAKAHVASKRLTNRVQLLAEGRVGGGAQAPAKGPFDQFAPFAFRPCFLEALATLPSASNLGSKLSVSALEHLSQLLLLSSPTPVIPSGLPLGLESAVVADSPKDVNHMFHTLSFHARSALSARSGSSTATPVHAWVEWLSLLLASHPRLVSAWWAPAPQAELTRSLIGAYRALSVVADTCKASRSTATLNGILVRILGVGRDASIVDKALSVSPLSAPQRAAYTSAVAALCSHAVPLFAASPSATDSSAASLAQWTMASPAAVSAVQWTNAFASLLLQELCALQLEHAQNAARVAAPAGPTRQSAAFAMLAATARSSASNESEDGWSAAQRSIVRELKSAAKAFA